MCERCKETRTTAFPVPRGGNFKCEWCTRRAALLVRDPDITHLCGHHQALVNQSLSEGMGDFVRRFGFASAGTDFLPIEEEQSCEYADPPVDKSGVTPCGGEATWAKIDHEEDLLCREHAAELLG